MTVAATDGDGVGSPGSSLVSFQVAGTPQVKNPDLLPPQKSWLLGFGGCYAMVCFGNNSLLLEAEFCLRCSLTSSLDLINGLSITRSFFSLAGSRTFPHFCLLRSYFFICFCSPAFRTWDQKGQFHLSTEHIEYKRPVRTALLSIPG